MYLTDKIELINRLLTCDGCTCCDAGTVYVLSREVDFLRSQGVEVLETFGYHFIPQGANGCLYNDPIKKKCTIYEHRPICCRLFPFDIYLSDFSQDLYWVYYKKCKKIVEVLGESQNLRGVLEIINEVERHISLEDILEFYKMNIVTRRIERGENIKANYQIVKPLRCKIDKIMRRKSFERVYCCPSRT